MSAEARMLELIDDAVRAATTPLEKAVGELSARLAALEGADGPADGGEQKKPVRGRTARAKAQPAEAAATADDGASARPADDGSAGASSEPAGEGEKVPEQRKGSAK